MQINTRLVVLRRAVFARPCRVFLDKYLDFEWNGRRQDLHTAFGRQRHMCIIDSLGTVYVLMQNAIMLGAFQYFFFDQGMLWESARIIWIHGTIEISVIIIAGCAGLVVGKSILFPQTFTRLASFIQGVKNGLKIVISTIPFFIIAGFLEGFVTRQTEMPDWLAISIITVSLAVILFYYVFYPFYLNKKSTNA